MNLQNEIVKKFMEHFQFPTLREMTRITGINTSRVYRIIKGSEMKLKEYECFCQCINHHPLKDGDSKKVSGLIGKLSSSALSDIEDMIEEKLKVHQWLGARS